MDIKRLDSNHLPKPFDCGDDDLNDFWLNDAINYQKQLLANTYYVEDNNRTLLFFSILHDKISINESVSKNWWRKNIRDTLPEGKRFSSYPAVKIGRLGIDNSGQGKGLGSYILDFIKELYLGNESLAGCRFITLDAYKQSIPFYQKNQFQFFTATDENEETRLMYFDLMNV